MKDYYNEFLELCLLQCLKNDYLDKKRLKENNRAVTKLAKLTDEMITFDSTDILNRLLCFDDCRVKKNAAFICLKKNVLVEEALSVLKELTEFIEEPFVRFGAYRILDMYYNKDEMIFKHHQNNGNTEDGSMIDEN